MVTMKTQTRNKAETEHKPRVYFTCHPADFPLYFQKICDDILRTHDCVICYTEDMTQSVPPEDRPVDIGRNNLMVIPVTARLLTTPNRAMDEDFPYAMQEHMAVLPIMMEPGIDSLYAKPDKFGELQYLNPFSRDATEISYSEKLRKYLDSVLIGDALAARIRAAFDAISNREREYLLYRFGFEDDMEHPLTETAEHFFLSESRAKSTEKLALDNVWLELPWWFH